ncbi:MAG: acyltransferase [Butyrivibrio sp.]|nr:acyltransferase [Butyrivibrio sp.]
MKKRNPGFELLRIIAMFMILFLHYNQHTGALLKVGENYSAVKIFANIIESFCIAGINTYVLISGFFLSKGRPRITRLLNLLLQVYFYTLVISVAMMAVGSYALREGNFVYKLSQYIFPISTEHYWFVTAYVIMYVLSPVMNAAAEHLTRRQLKAVIIGLLVWFSFIKSFVPLLFPTDRFGYDYGWFICLYLIAAYIRRYDVALFGSAQKSAVVYLASCCCIAAMSISLYFVNLRWGGFVHYQTVPFGYNFFFTLTASLGLFSFFRNFRMKEGKFADAVRFIGPLTFGVYLLHMHVEIRDRWVDWISALFGKAPMDNILLFSWHAVRTVVIVFAAGIFVDWVRKLIFDYLSRAIRNTWISKKLFRLDEEIWKQT